MENAVQISQIIIAICAVLAFGCSFFSSYKIIRVGRKADVIEQSTNGIKKELMEQTRIAAEALGYERGRLEGRDQERRDVQHRRDIQNK